MAKKSFQGSYLELRHKTYYAVLSIPKDVRNSFLIKRFVKSTKTTDKTVAQGRATALVLGWKNEIQRARNTSPDPLVAEALELLQHKKRLDVYSLVNDIIEQRSAEISNESSPIIGDEFEAIASGKRIALRTLLTEWRLHEQERGIVDKTIDQASRDIELLFSYFPTANLLEAKYINIWIKEICDQGDLTPSSLTRILSSCRSFFKFLQHIGEIAPDATEPFKVPSQYKRSTKPNAKSINKIKHWIPFSIDEVNKIHAEASKTNDESLVNLIILGAYTGARIEELCSLKCNEVNLKSEELKIIDSKSAAGIRSVPIHKNIKQKLEQLTNESTDGYIISGLTFNKYNDRSNAIGKRFGRLKTKLNFSKQHTFHSIRKTVVTVLENARVPEGIASDIVGHEKPTMTYGLYSGGASLSEMQNAIKHLSYDF